MERLQQLASLMSETTIYTGRRLRIIIFSFCGIFVIEAIVLTIFSKRSDAWPVGILILLIPVVLGVVAILATRNKGLITGREGIIFAGQGYTIYTPWNNIQKITHVTRGGKDLQLHATPAQIDLAQGIREGRAAITIHGKALLPKKSYSPYDGYHLIPIQNFSTTRNHHTLEQDFERYAPQLQQEGQKD